MYAEQCQEKHGKINALWQEPFTATELKAWLGLVVAMGIHELPQIPNYWTSEWVLTMPAFSATMNRQVYCHPQTSAL